MKLFILPKHASPDARFLLLNHPRDSARRRFYFCPGLGLYEFTKVAAPCSEPRSLLLTSCDECISNESVDNAQDVPTITSNLLEFSHERQLPGNSKLASGYVNKATEVFIATPFDMVFLLLPILCSAIVSKKSSSGKALFQPIDDMLEGHTDSDRQLQHILEKSRSEIESAAATICDTVEAGDEVMFRFNEGKLFKAILDKAERVVEKGLPASLEEKFVGRALERPVLSVRREESSISITREVSDLEGHETRSEAGDSHSSASSTVTSFTTSEMSAVTTVSSIVQNSVSSSILHLQRLRVAFMFIVSSYVHSDITGRLEKALSSDQSPIDFAPLHAHLENLARVRAEAATSRSFADFSHKRGFDNDETVELKSEKKRKLEEEEKRKKAGESRGVKELKMVNVTGMMKMSDFFAKKTAISKVKA